MRHQNFIIILATLLTLIAVGLWWASPKQQVKRQLHALIDAANVPPTMAELARSARGQRVADLLADPLHLSPPDDFQHRVPPTLTQDEAAPTYAAAARSAAAILLTNLANLHIATKKDTATARFQIDALVDLSTSRPIDGTIHVETSWAHIDRRWRLQHLSWTNPTPTPSQP